MDQRRDTERPGTGRPAKHQETATEARQGVAGRPVLWVLIGGLALGALYIIGTQIWNASEDLPDEGAVAPAVEPAEADVPEPL